MIHILIADDHKIFREGLVSILEDEADIRIVGQANNGTEVLDQLEQIPVVDLILMDISMGETSGIDTSKTIKEKYPEIHILMLSMHDETDYILQSVDAGAAGYLLKDSGSTEMIKAIREVAMGNTYFSQKVTAVIMQHINKKKTQKEKKAGIPLTRREMEVLQLIAEEFTNPEIAEKLFISVRTVDTHRRNLLDKLAVKNTAGLVKYAIRQGIID